MVRNNGHNQDGGANDAHKEARGLIAASFGRRHAHGRLEDPGQPGRGEHRRPGPWRENNGGLYGERAAGISRVTRTGVGDAIRAGHHRPAGTSWYRTTFDIARAQRPRRVARADDRRSGRAALRRSLPGADLRQRLELGQYIGDVGPQHTFVLPTGVLNANGRNTLALAVTSDGGPTDVLEKVELTNFGTARGGLRVRPVDSPRYDALRPRLAR